MGRGKHIKETRRHARRGRRYLPRWTRTLLLIGAAAGLLKLAAQVYIQLSPRITPPAAGFLLHSRARQKLREISSTLAPLQLENGLRVLEVGGGTGAFTAPLAEQAGRDSAVYSIELQRGMLRQQAHRLRASKAHNIHLHQANALDLPFRAQSFDRAVLIAVLPMLPDKQRALRELRRVLKPGGLLAVSEELIEPEYVPLALTRRWCERAGFRHITTDRRFWFYTLVFRNPAEEKTDHTQRAPAL